MTSLFSEKLEGSLGDNFRRSIEFRDVKSDILDKYNENFSFVDLQKLAIDYSDGVIGAGKDVNPELMEYAEGRGLPVMTSPEDDKICQAYEDFYDRILEAKSE